MWRFVCGKAKKGILNALQVAAGPAGGALVAMVMFVMLRKGSDRIRHTRRRVLCGALRAGITAEFFWPPFPFFPQQPATSTADGAQIGRCMTVTIVSLQSASRREDYATTEEKDKLTLGFRPARRLLGQHPNWAFKIYEPNVLLRCTDRHASRHASYFWVIELNSSWCDVLLLLLFVWVCMCDRWDTGKRAVNGKRVWHRRITAMLDWESHESRLA